MIYKLYTGTSSLIKFTLKDSDGNAVNDATVNGTLVSPFDVRVLDNVAFTYVTNSAGVYEYTVNGNTFNPPPDRNFVLTITAVSGSNRYQTVAAFTVDRLSV